MLANNDYNNISIENYRRKIFTTLMLELCVFVKILLTLVYSKVIVNIQC